MRFPHALIIVLALQVRGCEAGLFDWIAKAWNTVTNAVVTAANEFADAVITTFNATVAFVRDPVKHFRHVYDNIRNWILELVGKSKEWGEHDWECGANNFWPSKVAAKVVAELGCKEMFEQINDACKKHDSCYSRKVQTRTQCDKTFCEELDDIRNDARWYHHVTCRAPDFYCLAVIYAGHTAYKTKLSSKMK